ncbi:MAG: MFS transporter [Actinobacteria bacterium]|nr:MFS transporter [Actinomycetota bacterium]
MRLDVIVMIFLISQMTAAPGTFLMGRLADKIGAKPTISILIVLWITVLGYAVFASSFIDFLIIGLMAGVGVGALTTVSRTMMSLVSPAAHQAEFFGFFAVAGRASAVLGPPLFGAVSSLTGDLRYALPALMLLLAAALVLVQRVDTGTNAEGGSHPG